MKSKVISYLNALSSRNILFGGGFLSVAVISVCGLGIAWSFLLAATIVAVYVVKDKLGNGDYEKGESFENVYTVNKSESKRKRMFAKRKEKYERKMKQENDAEDDLSRCQLPAGFLSEENLDDTSYELFGEFDSVFGYSDSNSGRKMTPSIPSLRSPQPLLSAFNSRVSKRDSFNDAPLNQSHLLSPRSVFGNLQNRRIQSPVNRTFTVKDTKLFLNNSQNAHKAMSPPSGLYFSRIRQDFEHSSILSPHRFETPKKELSSRQENTYSSIEKQGDSISKEAVVKALQQKVASKRKRTPHGNVEFKADETEQGVKKRRIQSEILETTVDQFSTENISSKDTRGASFQQSSLSKHLYGKDEMEKDDDLADKDGVKTRVKKNKYGIDKYEVDSISEEENMEIDKKQSKRKAPEDSDILTKEKKNREDARKNTKKSDTKQTPKSKKTPGKKKTPVRSVETQTPTKMDDENKKEIQKKSTESPKTPFSKTTSFQRVLTSGFPSNLKSRTPEKRQRIPIYTGSLADIENIEMGREEYGERGVTCEAYKADKKAALERTIAFINGEDDEEIDRTSAVSTAAASTVDASQTTTSLLTATQSSFEKTAASVTPQQNSNTPVTKLVTTSLPSLTPSTTSNIQFGLQPASFASGGASQKASESETSKEPITSKETIEVKQPSGLITSLTASLSNTTSTPSFGSFNFSGAKTSLDSQPKSTESAAKVSSQGQTLSTTGFTFGAAALPKAPLAAGGLSFGTPTSNTSSSSGTPGFTFGQKIDTSPKPSSVQLSTPAINTSSASLPSVAKSQANATVFGGLTFGSTETKQGTPTANFGGAAIAGGSLATGNSQASTSVSLPTTSDTLPKPFTGFSFGSGSSDSKTSSITFGTPTAPASSNTAAAATSSSTYSGFSFGSSAASSSQTATTSSASLGGFSFGSAKPSLPTSSTTQPAGFGGFKFDNSKQGETGIGGFSFGKSVSSDTGKISANIPMFGTDVPASTTAGTLFQTALSKDGNVFGAQASTSGTTNIFGAAVNPLQTTQNAFGSATQSTTQQPSIFGAQAASQTPSLFGSQTQPATAAPALFASMSKPSASNSVFGASAPTLSTTGTLFGQNSQSGGPVFGSTPAVTTSSSSIFETPISSSGFSFGSGSKPVFGSGNPAQASATTGGFSFGANATPSAGSGSIFGQSNATQNPFGSGSAGSGSVFGQPTPTAPVTTAGGFSFGSATQNAFGQPSSNPTNFGAGSAFGATNAPSQMGGFNFGAAVSAPKPAEFSFGGGASGANSGFTSRPGTPTQFGSGPPAAGDIMNTPQLQAGAFAIGSGSTVAGRPTVKGRRRMRR